VAVLRSTEHQLLYAEEQKRAEIARARRDFAAVGIVNDFIQDNLSHSIAVGTVLRQPALAVRSIRSRSAPSQMLPVARRRTTQVDHDVEDPPAQHPHELRLRKRRRLKMEPRTPGGWVFDRDHESDALTITYLDAQIDN
jgi:hypothetical protein